MHHFVPRTVEVGLTHRRGETGSRYIITATLAGCVVEREDDSGCESVSVGAHECSVDMHLAHCQNPRAATNLKQDLRKDPQTNSGIGQRLSTLPRSRSWTTAKSTFPVSGPPITRTSVQPVGLPSWLAVPGCSTRREPQRPSGRRRRRRSLDRRCSHRK
jgi:hypothetical protein